MSKKKLLIIDDEADFGKLVKANLELTGNFEVSTATDGKRGLALARKIKPDLILLDIMMPLMDGFQVLKQLKKDTSTTAIPVVMLTARGDDAYKLKAVELYNDGYITKPIDTDNLKAIIEKVIKRHIE